MDSINSLGNVLYLWQTDNNLEQNVGTLKAANKSVTIENCDRIESGIREASSIDATVLNHPEGIPSAGILAAVLKVLKPKTKLLILNVNHVEEVKTALLFAGFVNVSRLEVGVSGEKPNYEVGSSAKLSFAKAPAVSKAWKIDNDDEDIIDADDLLDEEDLVKPDPSSLRVCGTTGVRKACKDCSCGLAEELDSENGGKPAAPTQKSSCGSCYLGDAFRCASCPYLGMPAFKPGEKIQLNDNLMSADL